MRRGGAGEYGVPDTLLLEDPLTPDPAPTTLGVEEEFLLVDPVTRDLVPAAARVLEAVDPAIAGGGAGQVTGELTQAQVETATPVCGDLSELRQRLQALRSGLAVAAEENGVRLAALAAPVLPGEPPPITESPRYRALADHFGPIAEDQGVCGCHVHVGMPDRRTAVAVGTLLRPWLPALLALTAGSPLWRGRDTGYASWRSVLWSRWPVSGPTPPFQSPEEYDAVVDALVASGVVLDSAQVYWTVRPSEQHPTLEVRVTDVCATVDEAVLLAGLVRGLAVTAAEALRRGDVPPPAPQELLTAAHWRAARSGLEGVAVDVLTGRSRPAWGIVDSLLAWVRPALEALGDADEIEHLLDRLRVGGSNAARQRAVLREGGTLPDVVDTLVVVPA